MRYLTVHSRTFRLLMMATALGLWAGGCAGELAKRESHREDATGETFSARVDPVFEKELKLIEEKEVSAYLDRLAAKLRSKPTEARLHAPASSLGLWANYGASLSKGRARIYLSTHFLKATRFENEVAAAIGIELGFIARGIPHVPERMMTAENWQTACEEAVGMLYAAGIDPRGVSSLLALIEKSRERSQLASLTPDELEDLKESVRAAIARQAPLRNPIVRSPEYAAIRKKMERL
jgi:hypothetical protein